MRDVTASDNPEKLSMSYLNIEKITIPQFNVRLGYFFKDKWAVTLGYDHMKYLMDHPQEINLEGEIQPGVSDLWSGTYDNQLVTSDYEHIHYENSDGLNYIRVELARYFDLLFFFQAEDGIRRGRVTGVQTCALPISHEDGGDVVLAALPVRQLDEALGGLLAVLVLEIRLELGGVRDVPVEAVRREEELVAREHLEDRKSVV